MIASTTNDSFLSLKKNVIWQACSLNKIQSYLLDSPVRKPDFLLLHWPELNNYVGSHTTRLRQPKPKAWEESYQCYFGCLPDNFFRKFGSKLVEKLILSTFLSCAFCTKMLFSSYRSPNLDKYM